MRDRVTKKYLDAAGVDISGFPSGLKNLANAEISQLEAIDATTVSGAQWGYLGALTRPPIGGDTTSGRVLRQVFINVDDGTNANTLKCNVGNLWNGDVIAVTDNVAKGATTGNFTLSAGGSQLIIEKAGLSGNVVMAHGHLAYDQSGTANPVVSVEASANDIMVEYMTGAAAQDLTAAVDAGAPIEFYVLYITSA